MVDTNVSLCGVKLTNPVVPASGTFGFGKEFSKFYDINILGSFSFFEKLDSNFDYFGIDLTSRRNSFNFELKTKTRQILLLSINDKKENKRQVEGRFVTQRERDIPLARE